MLNESVDSTDFSLILDAGGFSKGYGTTAPLQTDYLLKGMAMLNYDGVNLAVKDFSEGGVFLQSLSEKHRIDLLSANIVYSKSNELFAKPFVVKKLAANSRNIPFKKLTIGLFGLCDEKEALLHSRLQEEALKSAPPIEAAQKIVPQLKRQVDLVILLYNGRFNTLESLLSHVEGIDVVILGGEYYRAEQYSSDKGIIIASSPSLGKYFATLTIDLDKDKKITASQKRRIPLDEQIEDNPKLARLVADFDRASKDGMTSSANSR
ncbi:hypothetical protein JW998_16850 [candidate division KSB1 bacterium]|nr:hypothetical protein [candidate division KSB1 bacterium]